MSVQYTCQGGATSSWGGLPMQWDTLPADWKGVAATPTMTPSYTYSFYGLSDETGGTGSLSQGVAGAWACCAAAAALRRCCVAP